MVWKRDEDGMIVVLDLSKITEMPMVPKTVLWAAGT